MISLNKVKRVLNENLLDRGWAIEVISESKEIAKPEEEWKIKSIWGVPNLSLSITFDRFPESPDWIDLSFTSKEGLKTQRILKVYLLKDWETEINNLLKMVDEIRLLEIDKLKSETQTSKV